MSRTRLLSSREVAGILSKEGFLFISQKGSHGKFRKKSGSRTIDVIVPMGKREIPRGTLRSIMRQSGLPEDMLK